MRFLLFLITILLPSSLVFAQAAPENYAPNEIIIQLVESEQTAERNRQLPSRTGLASLDVICSQFGSFRVRNFMGGTAKPTSPRRNRPSVDNLLILTYSSSIDVADLVEKLEGYSLISYAEPNYIGRHCSVTSPVSLPPELIPNDYTSELWWAKNDGSFAGFPSGAPNPVVGADIDVTEAWTITTGSAAVTLAVLDTGLDPSNNEFTGRLVPGYDFVHNDNNPTDDQGHGTNVTGLAAMTGNNNFGLAGVDWQCRIMPVKVLDANNLGFYSDFAAGVIYAVDNGADVINMSLGGTGASQTLLNAVQYAYNNGVTVVAAMGNDDGNVTFYPAAYAETIAVGATDINDYRVRGAYTGGAWGSNYTNYIDLVAPGNSMLSTRYNDNQAFNWWMGGTSQATPLVAGTATLLLSIDPSLGVEQIRGIIRKTADDRVGSPAEDTPGYDIYHGAGRLNVYQAVRSAQCPTGGACDDGNPLTINDVYTTDCNCEGVLAVTLTAPSGNSNYQWWQSGSGSGSPISGANGSSYAPTQAGVYYATYSNAGCGAATDYFIATTDCTNRTVNLSVGNNTGDFRWYRNGSIIGSGTQVSVTANNTLTHYYAMDLNCDDTYPGFYVILLSNCNNNLVRYDDTSTEEIATWEATRKSVADTDIRLRPNPVARSQDILVEVYQTEATNAQVRIVDMTGKLVHQRQVLLLEGWSEFSLNTAQLVSGIYYLVTDQGMVQRFVVTE